MKEIVEYKKTSSLKALFIITIVMTFVLAILTGLLVYLYHQTVWTLTINFNFIYFVWVLLFAVIIGLLIVTLSFILVKKSSLDHKRIIIPPALVVFLAIFSVSFALIDKGAYNAYYTFSKERWAMASKEERSVYLDSFLKKHDLYTFNDELIIEYLGEPDEKETIELLTYPTQYDGSKYFYDLGYARDFIDSSFLKIETNQLGNVTYYQIYST